MSSQIRNCMVWSVVALSAGLASPAGAQTAVVQANSLNIQVKTGGLVAGDATFTGTVYSNGASPKEYAETSISIGALPQFSYSTVSATRTKITNAVNQSFYYVDLKITDDYTLATLKDSQEAVMADASFNGPFWTTDASKVTANAVHVFLAACFLPRADTGSTFNECVTSAIAVCGGGRVKSVTWTKDGSCSFVCKTATE